MPRRLPTSRRAPPSPRNKNHGQDHRLSGNRTAGPHVGKAGRAHPQLSRIREAAGGAGSARPGGALHGLRHSLLSPGLPGQQSDPGLEQSGLSRPVAYRVRDPALDQQFPGIHRPHLPRALRGELHAQHRRRAGDDQIDRMRDRRSRLGGRLDPSATAGEEDRQIGRGGRLGPRRHGLRPAARPRRP